MVYFLCYFMFSIVLANNFYMMCCKAQLEPMRFSKATERCFPDAKNCVYHFPQDMFQFFSVLLSKSTIGTQSIQLYGYIAARDVEDGMLNYIVNYSRDDPIVVQQVRFCTHLQFL